MKSLKVYVVGALLWFGLLAMTSLCLAQGDFWTPKEDMPTGRFLFSCEAVDGKFYAIGGATADGDPTLATVEEYDPVGDTWTSKQDMPTRRRSMYSAVVDGKIYIIGGVRNFIIGQTNGVRTVEVYDPTNDTWDTQKTDMPTAREGGSASAVNGIIYVMGGVAPGGVFLSLVEAYDPATDTWTTKKSMPTARHGLSTCEVNGKIYAMGSGRGGRMVEEYDPATDTWTTKDPMRVGNGYFGTGVVDGTIYTMGGSSPRGSGYSRVFAYDPLADTWSEKTAMLTARFGLSAGVVNGKIYAIGGTPGWPPSPLAAVEEYTPESVVSVEHNVANSPESFALHQNYPNPFNPQTEIRFQLPEASHVVVRIFNNLGQEILTLLDMQYEVGYYSVRWDGKDNHGNVVASGIYFYQLQAGEFSQVKKMTLLR